MAEKKQAPTHRTLRWSTTLKRPNLRPNLLLFGWEIVLYLTLLNYIYLNLFIDLMVLSWIILFSKSKA